MTFQCKTSAKQSGNKKEVGGGDDKRKTNWESEDLKKSGEIKNLQGTNEQVTGIKETIWQKDLTDVFA